MKKHTELVNKKVHTVHTHSVDSDIVICEQPLQIKLIFVDKVTVSDTFIYTVTMRTPGDEQAHIAGLLLADGIITDITQIVSMTADNNENTPSNSWDVELIATCKANLKPINKYQPAYSSCGLCGNTSLKALELKGLMPLSLDKHWLDKQFIFHAENTLYKAQPLQSLTGGAHCAALFDQQGNMIAIKEDIGRHNALDKLFGHVALTGVSISDGCNYVIISSRVSFEMVQKVLVAGIPVLIALGAPSALAINAAKRFNLTLIAFLKANTFNVYHGEWRLKNEE